MIISGIDNNISRLYFSNIIDAGTNNGVSYWIREGCCCESFFSRRFAEIKSKYHKIIDSKTAFSVKEYADAVLDKDSVDYPSVHFNINSINKFIKSGDITSAKTIYIDKSCKFAKRDVEGFKITRDYKKADVVIVPKNFAFNITSVNLFSNSDGTEFFASYDIESPRYASRKQYFSSENIGKRLIDICDYIKVTHEAEKTDFNRFMEGLPPIKIDYKRRFLYCSEESKQNFGKIFEQMEDLIFINTVDIVTSETQNTDLIIDIVKGNVQSYITDEDFMKYIMRGNDLTEESFNSIFDMLTSEDESTCILGVMCLSKMDYYKYRNSCLFLLRQINYITMLPKIKKTLVNNTAIRYMFKYLHFDLGTYGGYIANTSLEDKKLMYKYVKERYLEMINGACTSQTNYFPFIGIEYNIDVKFIFDENTSVNESISGKIDALNEIHAKYK